MPEVKLGPDGGYAQAFCHYCGWASNAKGLDEAVELNAAHERQHPEWTEPPSLEGFVESLHADHDCKPGKCPCIEGRCVSRNTRLAPHPCSVPPGGEGMSTPAHEHF